jgi:hypothetical protein
LVLLPFGQRWASRPFLFFPRRSLQFPLLTSFSLYVHYHERAREHWTRSSLFCTKDAASLLVSRPCSSSSVRNFVSIKSTGNQSISASWNPLLFTLFAQMSCSEMHQLELEPSWINILAAAMWWYSWSSIQTTWARIHAAAGLNHLFLLFLFRSGTPVGPWPRSTRSSPSPARDSYYPLPQVRTRFSTCIFFCFLCFSKIPAYMQILVNSYLLIHNSKYKVFYMKFVQKNV